MKLQLPTRRTPDRNDFDTSTGAVKLWVDDLPLINPDKTGELLEDALDRLNRLDIEPRKRFDVMELLITPVLCVTDARKNAFLGKPIPLTGKALEAATVSIDLCKRMATGYEILAEDLENDISEKSLLTTAIHRALRYLSEELLTNYQIYIQQPEGLWREIHTLYALAELKGIAARPVTDTTLPASGSSAIDTVYKQILLLTLACPYHLHQNEIHYVYNALLDWADYSRIAGADDAEIHALFAVNLGADNPPAYRALGSDGLSGDELRVLDTGALEGRLQEVISGQPGGSAIRTGIGNTRTLQRLMLCWGVMPERESTRQPQDEPVKLAVGLNNAHLFIYHTSHANSADSGMPESLPAVPVLHDPTVEKATSINIEKGIGNPFRKAMATTASRTAHDAYLSGAPEKAQMESWKIADMSTGGYCLLHDSPEVSRARIGELVVIANPQDQDPVDWRLGVVRWMKFSLERGLELGIQMLAHDSAQAIWASVCNDGFSGGNRMQGILLTESNAVTAQNSLLLPSIPFRTGCTTELEDGSVRTNVMLIRELENTGSFAQYHFTAAGQS